MLHETEICELRVPQIIHQNIRTFDVAMDHPDFMDCVKTPYNASHINFDNLFCKRIEVLQEVINASAWQELCKDSDLRCDAAFGAWDLPIVRILIRIFIFHKLEINVSLEVFNEIHVIDGVDALSHLSKIIRYLFDLETSVTCLIKVNHLHYDVFPFVTFHLIETFITDTN